MASSEGAVDVGIRELRNHLSRYLAEVRAGGEITVTDRGRAVARIVPIEGERKLDRLIREGRVIPATSHDRWLPEKLIQPKASVVELFLDEHR